MNKIPEKIGQFVVDRLIAEGRISNVLVGSGPSIPGWPAKLVIKHLREEYARDKQVRGQFQDAMRVWSQLSHPSIVQVLRSECADGACYGVMELVRGWNLHRVMERAGDSGIPASLAAYVAAQVAGALEAAHQAKDLDELQICPAHGGINPFNVLLSVNGHVKVIDFQMYRVGNVGSPTDSHSRIRTSFLSPEQCSSLAPDQKSDVFAVGALLYALATGRMPFLRSSRIETLQAVMQVQYANPTDLVTEFPDALASIIAKALNRKAGERYRSCGELKTELEKYLVTAGGVRQQIVLSDFLGRNMGEPDEGELVDSVADGGGGAEKQLTKAAVTDDASWRKPAEGAAKKLNVGQGSGVSETARSSRSSTFAGADLFNPWNNPRGQGQGQGQGTSPASPRAEFGGGPFPSADGGASQSESVMVAGDPQDNPYAVQFAMLGGPLPGQEQRRIERIAQAAMSGDPERTDGLGANADNYDGASPGFDGHGDMGAGSYEDVGGDGDAEVDVDPTRLRMGKRQLIIGLVILVAIAGFLWLTRYMGQGEERKELLARSKPPVAGADGSDYALPAAPVPDGVLSITTKPADAQVLVAYSLVEKRDGQAAYELEVPTGHKLNLIVSAPGYVRHTALLDIPVDQKTTSLSVELQPLPEGSPGVVLFPEPENPEDEYPEAGNSTAHGKKTAKPAAVKEDAASQVGVVMVESVPEGAMIYYEGSIIGSTPSRFTMPAGSELALFFRKEGHTPHLAVFNLKPNATNLVRVNLGTVQVDKERRELALHSRPELARVVRDGSYTGSTPQYIRDSVNRLVPIRFTYPNHSSVERNFFLKNNSITYIAMLDRIEKAKGFLSVESTEPVTVYVGNEEIGPSPVRNIQLEMGTHSVSLSNERKELRAYFDVEIIAGQKVQRKAVWKDGKATIQ